MKIHYGIIIIMCCLLNACQPASQNPRIYDSGISQELAELRKQEINELKYDLRLSIPKQKSMPVEGEIHVRFRLNKAQEVILDFREEADKIKEVSANGLPTSYEFRNEHIILPKNTTQKGENDIYIRFTAGNQSLNRNDEFLYTLLVPDRARTVYGAYNEAVFSMVGENGRKALRTKWFRHVRENGLNISKRFFSLHGLTSALRLRGFSADLRAIALHRACRWG